APAGRIGARGKRGDDPRLLTGRGHYVDDVTLPRLVHAAFVRSVPAHARPARRDVDTARPAPRRAGGLTGAAAPTRLQPGPRARRATRSGATSLHSRGRKPGAVLPPAVDRVR